MRSQGRPSPPEPRSERPLPNLNGADSRTLRVPARASRLHWVREHVDGAAAAFGLGIQDRYQWVVAVNEAATNAIKHGRPYADGTFVVHLETSADTMVCSIRDNGQFAAAPRPADGLAERGRGFQLMELFTDKTEVSTGTDGTTVRLHKRRPTTAPELA